MRATREDGVPVELDDDGTWHLAPVPVAETVPVAEENEGFRGVPWGSAPAAAWEREGSEPDRSTETFYAWDDNIIAGLICDICYIYVNNKLVRGKYFFTGEFTNYQRYVSEFFNLKEFLVLKYGDPDDDTPIWRGSGDPPEDFDLSMKVAKGEVMLSATWEGVETRAFLQLTGENFESQIVIEYTSIALEAEEDAMRDAQILDVL